MSAQDEYEGIWDMFAQMHRETHGEKHAPTRDFNCCGEYAVAMALRAASTLRPEYRYHILWTELKEAAARIASLEQELEQSGARIAQLEETLRKGGVPAEAAEKA